MSYKNMVLSSDPLACWPLEDNVISNSITDFGKYNLQGELFGDIYENNLPIVSGTSKCLLLKSNEAEIIYPNIGASYDSGIWENGILWSKGKETTNFSVELFFKLNTTDININDRIYLFAPEVAELVLRDATYTEIDETYSTYNQIDAEYAQYSDVGFEIIYEPAGGLYIEDDKLIFATDEDKTFYVEYPISDWSQRYHVILNYNYAYLEMIINGSIVIKKFHTQNSDNAFTFKHVIGNFVTQTTDNYPLFISMVTIDNKNFSIDRAKKRYYASLSTINYTEHFDNIEKVSYMPSNRQTIPLFSFQNPWNSFNLNNIIQQNNYLTLPIIYDQQFASENPTYNTISSKTGLLIEEDTFLNISSILNKYGSKPFIFGITFYVPSTVAANSYILDINNRTQGTYLSAYVNSSKELVFDVNGSIIDPEPSLSTGWHDLVIVFNLSTIEIYLDGVQIEDKYLPITSYNTAILGSTVNITDFFKSNIAWVRVSEDLSNFYGYLNYGITGDKILKLNNNLKWYSKGSATYNFYVNDALDCDGSLAYHNGKLNGITVTYNDDIPWPQVGKLAEITTAGITEDFYTIYVNMETEDSQDNRPYLSNIGLNVYTENSKQIKANNEASVITISNKNDVILQQSALLLLNRFDNCGAKLTNGSYLVVPSIQDNTDTELEEGTHVINLFIKPTLGVSTSYIFETDATSSAYLRWNGTTFQSSGLSSIYYNGSTTFNPNVIKDDWVWISAVLSNRLDSTNNIYVGSDNDGASPTEMIVGMIVLSPYTQTGNEIQNEFEALTGIAKEDLVTDVASFNLSDSGTDLGLKLYNYPWQVA